MKWTGWDGGDVALELGEMVDLAILRAHGEIIFFAFADIRARKICPFTLSFGTLRPFRTSRDLPLPTVLRERAKRKSARQSVTNFQNFRITQSFASGR